jgi:hypothetical protein
MLGARMRGLGCFYGRGPIVTGQARTDDQAWWRLPFPYEPLIDLECFAVRRALHVLVRRHGDLVEVLLECGWDHPHVQACMGEVRCGGFLVQGWCG